MRRTPNLAVGSLLSTFTKAAVDRVDYLVIVILPICQFGRCRLPTAAFESAPSIITIATAAETAKAAAFVDPVP